MTTPARTLLCLLFVAPVACRPPTASPDLPLCPPLAVVAPDDRPPAASVWLSLLVGGYDPDARRAAGPIVACSGDPVAPPPDPCDPTDDDSVALDPLDDRALVFGELGDGHRLVWATTHRRPTGDVLGPVALVRVTPTRITVQALGILEAPPGALLSLVEAGADRLRYLVAEGERCPDASPDDCTREARILPLDGARFVPSAFFAANGQCVDSPRLPLARRIALDGDRTVVDRRLIATDEVGLFIHEELEILDGARLLRRAAETQRIDYRHGRLVVDAPSLWSRLSAQAHAQETPP